MKKLASLLLALCCLTAIAQDDPAKLTYQTPPDAITKLVDAPLTPSARLSPNKDIMLLLEQPPLPPLGEIAQEELRIAGLRLNPRTNGPSRSWSYRGLVILNISTGQELPMNGLPPGARITDVKWSPDGKNFAFLLTRNAGIELWLGDVASYSVRQLTGALVSDVMGPAFQWHPDGQRVLYKSILDDRGPKPVAPAVPAGPVVQENLGTQAAARTYQDLLKGPHDEAVFKFYSSAQLTEVSLDGRTRKLGRKGIIRSFDISPGGKHILVEVIHEPFSYLVPFHRFPQSIEVWDDSGNMVSRVADLPLAEDVPKGYGSVRKGPRSVQWRADVEAELYWTEAQDGGDARKEAKIRDRVFRSSAPFNGEPEPVLDMDVRFGRLGWSNDGLALVSGWWWSNRRTITWRFSPGDLKSGKTVLWDRSWEDKYDAPGTFMTEENEHGHRVLVTPDNGKTLFLTDKGASPEGNRPFVDQYDVASGKTTRLWRSEAPYYEMPVAMLNASDATVLSRRESVSEPPNYFVRSLKSKRKFTQLTDWTNPHPELSGIQKELVKYTRADGVELSATLYLPYKDKAKNKNLPVLLWAYPTEFKSKDAAGQVDDSPYRFDRIGWWSPLVWLTQGYAVMDDPKMPIVGEGEAEPNDTFVEQLVSSAQAAADYLTESGVGDPDRLVIGGHSYGAFMTANLLAHSDLFACGIARSGAYNRTLTPFGFQSEERTFWEAPDVYMTMSPFTHADKLNEPLLLIHGAADNNSGTFPMQSERFYNALKGHGAIARLVMLPHESHGYRARESVLHMMWEMHRWMERYAAGDGPE